MTFDLATIAIFIAAGILYAAFLPKAWRGWALLIGSVLAIYWLQPPLPIRFSAYLLQTAVILLVITSWQITRPAESGISTEDKITLALLFALIVGIGLFRFVPLQYRLIDRPPQPLATAATLLVLGAFVGGLTSRLRKGALRVALAGWLFIIIGLFVILKWDVLATAVSQQWRIYLDQDPTLAAGSNLAWLGFSYVAFRLIHTIRDRQTGILPLLSLREYSNYVLFAPAYIAGPIDRAERFVDDLRNLPTMHGLDAPRFADAGQRIAVGAFKKFVIADTLAQGMSLTATNAAQGQSTVMLWLLLYGYALRLYFDFSGYTDIAIGIGLLFGIRLPENFKRPYLQTNITTFWQSWHATLSAWARTYVFSPLSRWLLERKPRPSTTLIVFAAQVATMVTIGLWHGFTVNYFIWGLWHGIGLFVHKQWSGRTRKWYRGLKAKPRQMRAWTLFSWFLTFQFVVLGWVWFLLPTPAEAMALFAKLFGIG